MSEPYLLVDLDGGPHPAAVLTWIMRHGTHVLNVAGPRETKCPGIYQQAMQFLELVLDPAARVSAEDRDTHC